MIDTRSSTEDAMNRHLRNTALIAAALLGTLSLGACDEGIVINGNSGPRDTVTRDLEPVTAVNIGTSGRMRVVVGDTPSLTITASETVLEKITAVVRGDRLEIDLPGAWINPGLIEYELVMPALSTVEIDGSVDVTGELAPAGDSVGIDISGSGDVDLDGATAQSVTITIHGSGDVELDDVSAASVQVEIDGSGEVDLRGTTDTLDLRIPGSGNFGGGELAAGDVTVEIDGSGDALINAEHSLDVQINGSGDVSYLGDPDVSYDIDGSGDVGPA